MDCKKAMDRYLALDKNEAVPIGVTLHLIACRDCRTAVRRLTEAETLLARPLGHESIAAPVDPVDPVVAGALARIAAAGAGYPDVLGKNPVSLLKWFVVGSLLAAGFATVPFSFVGSWTRAVFGGAYVVPLSIVCGLAVTAYCGIFVGTNIDFFVKRFGPLTGPNSTATRG